MTRCFGPKLLLTLALCFVLPVLAHADYAYDFSGTAFEGNAQSFTFSSPTLLTSFTSLQPGFSPITWSSCVTGDGGTCVALGMFPDGATANAMNFDEIDLFVANDTQYFYYFDSGSFGQVGSYTATAQNFFVAGTGTLTITNTSAVPEPSSLILLGTGALGFFAPIRRKLLPRWKQ